MATRSMHAGIWPTRFAVFADTLGGIHDGQPTVHIGALDHGEAIVTMVFGDRAVLLRLRAAVDEALEAMPAVLDAATR